MDDGECKSCTALGGDYADCKTCKKVGSDVLCSACTTATNYLKANKKGCTTACTTESTYIFVTAADKKCAAHCSADDYLAGLTKIDFTASPKACILDSTAVPDGSF